MNPFINQSNIFLNFIENFQQENEEKFEFKQFFYSDNYEQENKHLIHEIAKIPREIQSKYIKQIEMGLFSQIKRVWIRLNFQLILWNYQNQSFENCCDFNEEFNKIHLVSIPENFLQNEINYFIIISTNSGINIVELFYSHEKNEIQIHSSHHLNINNVINSINSSSDGRIFLGGNDGNLYEIIYYLTDSSIPQIQFDKINHTSKISNFLSNYLFNKNEEISISQISIDSTRKIIYTLSQNSTISLFSFSEEQKITFLEKRTIESIKDEITKQLFEYQNFQNKYNDININNTNSKDSFWFQMFIQKLIFNLKITHIQALGIYESNLINLFAITSNGTRLYFSLEILDINQNNFENQDDDQKINQKIQVLKLRQIKDAFKSIRKPNLINKNLYSTEQMQLMTNLHPVYFGNGSVIGNINQFDDEKGTLFIISQNPPKTETQIQKQQDQDQEYLEESSLVFIDNIEIVDVNGTVLSIQEIPMDNIQKLTNLVDLVFLDKEFCYFQFNDENLENQDQNQENLFSKLQQKLIFNLSRNELFEQFFFSPHVFLCLTNMSLYEIIKLQPIHILSKLIQESNGFLTGFLKNFIEKYGINEVISMCFLLYTFSQVSNAFQMKSFQNISISDQDISSINGNKQEKSDSHQNPKQNERKYAFQAQNYHSEKFLQLLIKFMQTISGENGTNFILGFSLFFSRLTQVVWDFPLFVFVPSESSQDTTLEMRYSKEHLIELKQIFERIKIFIEKNQWEKYIFENQNFQIQIKDLVSCVSRCIEALFLLEVISEASNFEQILNHISQENQIKLSFLTFQMFISTDSGYSLAHLLIDSMLLTNDFQDQNLVSFFSAKFPTYFSLFDKFKYNGFCLLKKAKLQKAHQNFIEIPEKLSKKELHQVISEYCNNNSIPQIIELIIARKQKIGMKELYEEYYYSNLENLEGLILLFDKEYLKNINEQMKKTLFSANLHQNFHTEQSQFKSFYQHMKSNFLIDIVFDSQKDLFQIQQLIEVILNQEDAILKYYLFHKLKNDEKTQQFLFEIQSQNLEDFFRITDKQFLIKIYQYHNLNMKIIEILMDILNENQNIYNIHQYKSVLINIQKTLGKIENNENLEIENFKHSISEKINHVSVQESILSRFESNLSHNSVFSQEEIQSNLQLLRKNPLSLEILEEMIDKFGLKELNLELLLLSSSVDEITLKSIYREIFKNEVYNLQSIQNNQEKKEMFIEKMKQKMDYLSIKFGKTRLFPMKIICEIIERLNVEFQIDDLWILDVMKNNIGSSFQEIFNCYFSLYHQSINEKKIELHDLQYIFLRRILEIITNWIEMIQQTQNKEEYQILLSMNLNDALVFIISNLHEIFTNESNFLIENFKILQIKLGYK
ncbi:nuclear pore complex protein nup155 [Anaeramoeba ignava]|uniref:Nuclear pore complex protein nup155 n=1 Tax=Anaeramoeba ignava TaxID=1746090 RepID=A0A9Q0LT14_ANAIG|nr:nuclear pore complex protein nup155 [Anaeramoeba ignava]